MLAVRLDRPGLIGTVELPEPRAPGVGEALVAVRRVGICGTDYHALAGAQNFVQYPLVLGHEVAVDVLAVGQGVTEVREGDRCAVLPYVSCGRCAPCRRGRGNCCDRIEVLGVTADGGLRERMVLPARLLYRRPGLSLDQLALVETLGIGWHAVQRGTPDPADAVLVLGAGPIGLAVAECLRGRVTDVVVGDIHPARLALAAGQGFAAVPADDELTERLRTRGDGDLPTLVFDATGSKASMERAFSLVGAGGTLVLVGHTTGDLTFANPSFHAKELDVRGARNALPVDWTGVLDALSAGTVDGVSWINRRSTLASIGEDLPDLAAKPDLVLKAMVDIGGETLTGGKLLRLAAGDNVYIATADLVPGDVPTTTGEVVTVVAPVDLGHKIAAQDIPAGAQVVRSGMPIGRATTPIAVGQWVHTHNLCSDYIATLEHRGGPG